MGDFGVLLCCAWLQSTEPVENFFSGMNNWKACKHSTDLYEAFLHFSRYGVVARMRANTAGEVVIPTRSGGVSKSGSYSACALTLCPTKLCELHPSFCIRLEQVITRRD